MKAPKVGIGEAKNRIIIHRFWAGFYKVTLCDMIGGN